MITFVLILFTPGTTDIMASVDESVRMSSDERFENECTPCKEGNALREAKHYCPECSEYYCDSCELSHRRLKATKTHKVLHGEQMSQSTPQKKVILPVMYCSCNQNRLVEFICQEHVIAVCLECKGIHHRKCTTSSLKEKGRTVSISNLTETSDRLKAIAAKVNQLHEQQHKSIESFSKMKNACREQIEAMRQKLHTFVDEISDASLTDLETSASAHSHDNDDISTTTASMKLRLQTEEKLLQDAIATADGCQMIVTEMIAKQKCDDFQNITADIEKDFSSLEMSFDYDKSIATLTDKTTKLGNILVKTSRNGIPESLISMTVVEDKAASFSPKDVQRITGSAFMPSGDLLICDRDSKTVSLFDRNFKDVSAWQPSEQPWNVAAVTGSTALVSLPYVMKLQFIETRPTITCKSYECIALDKKCFGIAVVDDEIFVSCSDDPGYGEIRILDIAGNIKKKLGVSKDGGEPQLHLPAYILNESDQVIVSEYGSRHEIVCFKRDGNTRFKYSIPGSNLRGLFKDSGENIYVCSENKNYIHVITDGGTKHKTFLELPDTGAKPTSTSFRVSDNTLIVTCYTKVYVYKVKK